MSDSKLRFWLRAVWLVAYVLMVVSMLNNLFRLNTDAIAYMRVAEYWSVGNFDLAVNGYWGPLLSLLMVPFLWIGVDPLISGKLVMLISAAVFFHGSQFLVRSVGLGLLDELIMALVLALTLPSWMTEQMTPDLLVSGLAIYAIGYGISPEWLDSRGRTVFSGLLWGFAYLAKAVALPLGLITSLSLALFWRFGRAKKRYMAWRQLVVSIVFFAVVSLPLIVILSIKYGHVTFSTSGPIAHAIVGPGNDQPAPHPFGNTVYQPKSGRLTAWEEPSKMAYDYWSPFESVEKLNHQFFLIGKNVKTIFKFLAAFDGVGLFLSGFGVGTLVFGLALFSRKPFIKNWFNQRWRWLIIPVACLSAIYLPVYVLSSDQRYFYLFLPLLLILSFGLLISHYKNSIRIKFALAALFILPIFLERRSEDIAGKLAMDLALRMEKAGHKSPIVGSTFFSDEGHRLGLYVAWHLEQPWHGDVWSFPPSSGLNVLAKNKARAEAYRQSGAIYTIAINETQWAIYLDSNPGFNNVTDTLGEQNLFQLYEIIK